jgi:stage III sporulation protein SpoIIIAA
MLILDDPLLQKYIALRPNGDARRLRLERQLEVFLDEQLEKIDSSLNTSNELSDILSRLSSYIRYSKVNTKLEISEARLICSDNT